MVVQRNVSTAKDCMPTVKDSLEFGALPSAVADRRSDDLPGADCKSTAKMLGPDALPSTVVVQHNIYPGTDCKPTVIEELKTLDKGAKEEEDLAQIDSGEKNEEKKVRFEGRLNHRRREEVEEEASSGANGGS